MPGPRSALAAALLSLLALTCSGPAAADMRYAGEGFVALLSDDGEPLHWESAFVPMTVSLKGAPPGAFEAARRAFEGWEGALRECGATLSFVLRQTQEEGRLSSSDGENLVFWGPGEDVARTRTYSPRGRPALITGFDIVLNSGKPWGEESDGRVGYDVQAVLTHEIGHVLGLADVCGPAGGPAAALTPNGVLAMYGWSRCGETSKRTLKAGDRRGLHYLYGRGALAGRLPGLARARLALTPPLAHPSLE
jgi:hypothetical protein